MAGRQKRRSLRVEDAWSFYERRGAGTRDHLTERERQVAAICDLRQEVASGGFDSYLRYWGADTAPDAWAALPVALGQEWADLLAEAMVLFGSTFPANDVDARERVLDHAGVGEVLDAIDSRFYDLEASTDADVRLTRYLHGST